MRSMLKVPLTERKLKHLDSRSETVSEPPSAKKKTSYVAHCEAMTATPPRKPRAFLQRLPSSPCTPVSVKRATDEGDFRKPDDAIFMFNYDLHIPECICFSIFGDTHSHQADRIREHEGFLMGIWECNGGEYMITKTFRDFTILDYVNSMPKHYTKDVQSSPKAMKAT